MDTQSHNNTGSHIAGDAGAGSGNAGSGNAGAGSGNAGAGSGNASAGSHDAGAGSHATATDANASHAKAGIPALRFTDFKGTPPWKSHTLSDICSKISAGGDLPNKFSRGQLTPTKEFPYPIYSNGINEKSLYGFSSSYTIDYKAITVSARGTIGWHIVRQPQFTPIVRLITLKPRDETINIYFLNHSLSVAKISYSDAGIPQLTVPYISKVRVLVPSLAEQEMVAAALTAVDDKVEALTQKVDLLETWKRGLMQQLFPQHTHRHNTLNATSTASHATDADATASHATDATGSHDAGSGNRHKRFPDFADAPPWQSHQLSEIFEEFKEVNVRNEPFEVLSVTTKGIVCQSSYFKREIASKNKSNYLIVRKGCLVISGLNFWMGALDFQTIREIGIVSPAYKTFNVKNNKYNKVFLRFVIRSHYMKKILAEASVQGASVVRRNLDKNMLLSSTLLVPSLAEQERVAAALTAVDDKIAGTREKLAATKQLKTYLLQNLFPN